MDPASGPSPGQRPATRPGLEPVFHAPTGSEPSVREDLLQRQGPSPSAPPADDTDEGRHAERGYGIRPMAFGSSLRSSADALTGPPPVGAAMPRRVPKTVRRTTPRRGSGSLLPRPATAMSRPREPPFRSGFSVRPAPRGPLRRCRQTADPDCPSPAVFRNRSRKTVSRRPGSPRRAGCRRREGWWRRRESNPRPKAFHSDLYMLIRIVAANCARKRVRLFAPAPHRPGESRRERYP